ncbi:hypothetical protein PMAYCL1PPCAC_28747, partial [Pristionchus mayeri]
SFLSGRTRRPLLGFYLARILPSESLLSGSSDDCPIDWSSQRIRNTQMNSDSRRPSHHNSRHRTYKCQPLYDPNDSANKNASSSSMAPSNKWNRKNGRGTERNGTSTSHAIPSVNCVMVEDDGWGEPNPDYWVKKERKEAKRLKELKFWADEAQEPAPETPPRRCEGARPLVDRVELQADWGDNSSLIGAQCATSAIPHEYNTLSMLNSEGGIEYGECSKESGEKVMLDERTEDAILNVYSNDLLMETIISHITQLSDRSRVEMASSRMFSLSKNAPYLFERGGDHLHIHFTTFDDMATIQYGSVVRTVPILTLDTRRFDNMEPRMTIALQRILDNISSRFSKNVRKITLGGTTEFYSARGVPDHHLILTYDFLKYLLTTFDCVTSLHLVNCGIDDGALDICDTPLWRGAMARMKSLELRCVWADTATRMPEILNYITCNLEEFTLTRFTCKRMGAALMKQLREADGRLKDIHLVIDEDSAEDAMEMLFMLKEVASRTDSLRITIAEIGDGSIASPKCFAILSHLRVIPNLTWLKVYVQPKNLGQFQTMTSLFRDLELLTSLRVLHMEGFVDQIWLTSDMIYNLADAFKTGMNYLAATLEDVSFANFPKHTKFNATGYKGDRKEGAYSCLWDSMASSIGTRKTKKVTLKGIRMNDDQLTLIYKAISRVAEEVYIKNIRAASCKIVPPLINGEFPMLRRLEVEIAVDPLMVARNLGEVSQTPHLQYAKFALKHRITNADHQMKTLKAMFSGVFVDQESPRGPLRQFIEVHHRIEGAQPPPPPSSALEARATSRPNLNYQMCPRTTEYRVAGYFSQPRRRQLPPKLLYGEWE